MTYQEFHQGCKKVFCNNQTESCLCCHHKELIIINLWIKQWRLLFLRMIHTLAVEKAYFKNIVQLIIQIFLSRIMKNYKKDYVMVEIHKYPDLNHKRLWIDSVVLETQTHHLEILWQIQLCNHWMIWEKQKLQQN